MILAAKALATLRGRDYAVPEDVRELALDVLRHRVVLSYEALADNVSADSIVSTIINAVRLPDVPLAIRERSASVGEWAPGRA
jgi:MoxR-like ATPase